MPNWCDQDLIVKGKAAELARFKEYAKSSESILDANRFIPYPEDFILMDRLSTNLMNSTTTNEKMSAKERAELTSEQVMARLRGFDLSTDGFNQGGYEWCIQNWGSKWGFSDVELERETTRSLLYSFRSAWSPLAPLIRKMGEVFPQLEFKLSYFEMGAAFQGKFSMKDGAVALDFSTEYKGNRGG